MGKNSLTKQSRSYPTVKRSIDIVVSIFLIVLLSPIYLVLAILVKLESPGPIIIRRRSLGRGGKEFDSFKLRTMVIDADEILRNDPLLEREFRNNFKLRDDPRVTKLGKLLRKTSLNELPQLVDVLLGYMSLVGPRPIAVDEVERYGPIFSI